MPVRYSKESAGPDTRRIHVVDGEGEQAETKGAAAAIVEVEVAAGAEVEATDAAINLAQELGIDLASIEGTGKDGKITVGDVRAVDA